MINEGMTKSPGKKTVMFNQTMQVKSSWATTGAAADNGKNDTLKFQSQAQTTQQGPNLFDNYVV